MSSYDTPVHDPDADELHARWLVVWNAWWHVIVGGLLIASSLLLHGPRLDVLDDLLVGGALVALAAVTGARLRYRRRVTVDAPRVGALLGLVLVAFTLTAGIWVPLAWESVLLGLALFVTDVVFRHVLSLPDVQSTADQL